MNDFKTIDINLSLKKIIQTMLKLETTETEIKLSSDRVKITAEIKIISIEEIEQK